MEQKQILLPKINQKHIAVIVLGIVACVSAFVLKGDSVPIITAVVGSIGGFIAGNSTK
jgi:hypothetical protein